MDQESRRRLESGDKRPQELRNEKNESSTEIKKRSVENCMIKIKFHRGDVNLVY